MAVAQAHAQERRRIEQKYHAGGVQKPKPKKPRRLPLRQLLLVFFLLVFVFSAWQLTAYFVDSQRTKKQEAAQAAAYEAALARAALESTPEITPEPTAAPTPAPTPVPMVTMYMPVSAVAPEKQAVFQAESGDILPELQEFYNQNDDLIGWIKINGVVNAPVVYRNNEYYLTRNFNKEKNAGGTIFLDERSPLRTNTQNLVLFGHNMRDGTVFGHLAKYQDAAFLRNHCLVSFSTLYETYDYIIFAVVRSSADMSSDRFVNLAGYPTFSSTSSFNRYMESLRRHSLFAWGTGVEPTDALLTMCTCLEGDERITLMARRLRENEDGKAIQQNYFRIR